MALKFPLGWSDFAKKHSRRERGNSYSTFDHDEVARIVASRFEHAVPGDGETTLDRKVLVPVPPEGFFCGLRAKLVPDMPVYAEVVKRQDHEDPYVETYTTYAIAKAFGALVERPAKHVDVVCYSAEALTENGEERSTDCLWEIVTILCREDEEREPMHPLAMARNYLEKPGGTKSEYTAREFAEAIWFRSTQQGIRVRG